MGIFVQLFNRYTNINIKLQDDFVFWVRLLVNFLLAVLVAECVGSIDKDFLIIFFAFYSLETFRW